MKVSAWPETHSPLKSGFTLFEMLMVIGLFGLILIMVFAGLVNGRKKAADNSIRHDIGQLRWMAEIVHDTQGGSYRDWSQHSQVAAQVQILKTDIDEKSHATNVTVIRETQRKDYCVSAPLTLEPGKYYCIDATAIFKTVTQPCPDYPASGPALRCPAT